MPDPGTDFLTDLFPSCEPPERLSEPVLLTLDQVAVQLDMSVKSVQRRIKSGVIRKAPIGGRLIRISSAEVRRLAAGELHPDVSEDPDSV